MARFEHTTLLLGHTDFEPSEASVSHFDKTIKDCQMETYQIKRRAAEGQTKPGRTCLARTLARLIAKAGKTGPTVAPSDVDLRAKTITMHLAKVTRHPRAIIRVGPCWLPNLRLYPHRSQLLSQFQDFEASESTLHLLPLSKQCRASLLVG